MKKLFMIATTAALLTGCNCQKASLSETLTHEWDIEKIDGKVLDNKGENKAFIGIDAHKNLIYGSTGCNRLTGTLHIDGNAKKGSIDLSKVGSTRMMCADMSTETQVLEALSRVTKYSVKGNILTLTDEQGNSVIELKSK